MSEETQTTPESVREGTSGGLNARNDSRVVSPDPSEALRGHPDDGMLTALGLTIGETYPLITLGSDRAFHGYTLTDVARSEDAIIAIIVDCGDHRLLIPWHAVETISLRMSEVEPF